MRAATTILTALLLGATTAPVCAADTVFVIRHMQKAAGDNPPLSAEGAINADRLAQMLKRTELTAVFATQTTRAEQTAAPVARQAGIAVQYYDPRDPKGLAAKIAEIPGAVLVVGHSNTVPGLVAAFGAAEPKAMTEQDYGSLFIVQRGSAKAAEIALPSL